MRAWPSSLVPAISAFTRVFDALWSRDRSRLRAWNGPGSSPGHGPALRKGTGEHIYVGAAAAGDHAMFTLKRKPEMPSAAQALPGRTTPIPTASRHFINGRGLKGPYPEGLEMAMFGLGCFWGAERVFWELGEGIHITAVGYAGGHTPNPTYQEVCTGRTGHNEVVLVVFDPSKISYERLLKTFWESHDPTQGIRQVNDVGTQYRPGIYVFTPAQRTAPEAAKASYAKPPPGERFPRLATRTPPS